MRKLWVFLVIALLSVGCSTQLPYSYVDVDAANSLQAPFVRSESVLSPTQLPTTPSPTPPIMPEETASPTPATVTLPGVELFSFGEGEPGWYTVDDDVMGGVSRSTVERIAPDNLIFRGNMSLENNGGFASVRSEWAPINLRDFDGVLLRVLGDGKAYRLRIRSAATGRDVAYNALFETTPDTWNLVYIRFVDMVPLYRGFLVDSEALDTAAIGSFGIMLSDKQSGDFELIVDWIRAISEEQITAQAAVGS